MADADITPSKICTRCGLSKPKTREHFTFSTMRGKPFCTSRCKPCLNEISKERGKLPAVKEQRKLSKRAQYHADPDKFREQKRAWAANNPDKIAAAKKREYAKNAEHQKMKALEWQRANPERARARKSAYKKSEKGRANAAKPVNKLRGNCSLAIRRFLKGQKSNRPWAGMVDYTMTELMAHIERQFTKGMAWSNYGSEWHLDHIIPLASFDSPDPNSPDFKRAFALANLRPLWAKENQLKGDKILTLL